MYVTLIWNSLKYCTDYDDDDVEESDCQVQTLNEWISYLLEPQLCNIIEYV